MRLRSRTRWNETVSEKNYKFKNWYERQLDFRSLVDYWHWWKWYGTETRTCNVFEDDNMWETKWNWYQIYGHWWDTPKEVGELKENNGVQIVQEGYTR